MHSRRDWNGVVFHESQVDDDDDDFIHRHETNRQNLEISIKVLLIYAMQFSSTFIIIAPEIESTHTQVNVVEAQGQFHKAVQVYAGRILSSYRLLWLRLLEPICL